MSVEPASIDRWSLSCRQIHGRAAVPAACGLDDRRGSVVADQAAEPLLWTWKPSRLPAFVLDV